MSEKYNVLRRLRRTIRNRTEKAIHDFDMIRPGDRVLIGVSGGSDSMCLLQFFREGLGLLIHDYSFLAVHIDLGFEKKDTSMDSYFNALGVDYRIVKTDIASSALDPEAKKNPCFICSLYRRREIYHVAKQEECNKIAYAHHKDDIVETLLINILYGRKIETMQPVQEVFSGNMFIIRPFTYIDESMLKQFAREMKLPMFEKHCPIAGHTRRDKVKQMIRTLQQQEKNANIKENIFKSIYHVNVGYSKKQ
ncbi:tRNA 2-thiocytidine(32) synthetase TtcA [bacterium]|nr:tRNA 2-thiocytidine(32) synthetase TtcA [bacterium]